MNAKEIRELSTEEITQRIADEKKAIHQMRFQHAVATLEDPSMFRHKRREIARLKTILHQRELANQVETS